MSFLDRLLNKVQHLENDESVYVRFTECPKLGLNPRYTYETPAGLHFFPLKYLMGRTKDHSASFTERAYAHVCHVNLDMPGVTRLENITAKVYGETKKSLQSRFESDFAIHIPAMLSHLSRVNASYELAAVLQWKSDHQLEYLWNHLVDCSEDEARVKIHYSKFWNLTRQYAMMLKKHHGGHTSWKWNSVFRSLGYEAFLDSGTGVVHPNEPSQALLFTRKPLVRHELYHNQATGLSVTVNKGMATYEDYVKSYPTQISRKPGSYLRDRKVMQRSFTRVVELFRLYETGKGRIHEIKDLPTFRQSVLEGLVKEVTGSVNTRSPTVTAFEKGGLLRDFAELMTYGALYKRMLDIVLPSQLYKDITAKANSSEFYVESKLVPLKTKKLPSGSIKKSDATATVVKIREVTYSYTTLALAIHKTFLVRFSSYLDYLVKEFIAGLPQEQKTARYPEAPPNDDDAKRLHVTQRRHEVRRLSVAFLEKYEEHMIAIAQFLTAKNLKLFIALTDWEYVVTAVDSVAPRFRLHQSMLKNLHDYMWYSKLGKLKSYLDSYASPLGMPDDDDDDEDFPELIDIGDDWRGWFARPDDDDDDEDDDWDDDDDDEDHDPSWRGRAFKASHLMKKVNGLKPSTVMFTSIKCQPNSTFTLKDLKELKPEDVPAVFKLVSRQLPLLGDYGMYQDAKAAHTALLHAIAIKFFMDDDDDDDDED